MELNTSTSGNEANGKDESSHPFQDDDLETRSHVSASSQRSTTSDKLMNARAKLAALKASQSFVDREAEMERLRRDQEAFMDRQRRDQEAQRRDQEAQQREQDAYIERQRRDQEAEMERQKKLLELEREAAITLAELQIYSEYEQAESGNLCSQVAVTYPAVEPIMPTRYTQAPVLVSSSYDPLSLPISRPVSSEIVSQAYNSNAMVESLPGSNPQIMADVQPVRSTFSSNFAPHCTSRPLPQVSFSHEIDPTPVDGTVNNTVLEAIRQSHLPKIELSVFSGDPIDFHQWLLSFENLIENSTLDPVKRLHYLLQFTSGNAKLLVSGYSLNYVNGYAAAKAELIKEFGEPSVLARAYLKKLDNWKFIPLSDSNGLKSFSIFLKSCRGSMHTLQHLRQLDTDFYLQKIVSKLAGPLQVSWRKHVCNLERSGNCVVFNDLVEFIHNEAHVARHPIFSAEALHDSTNIGIQSKSISNFKNRSVKNLATSASIAPYRRLDCPKCQASHDLDECSSFLSLPLKDRHRFVMSKRLCFGCFGHFSKNHSVKNCRSKKCCNICKSMHPTSLHGLQLKRQVDRSPPVDSMNSEETEVKIVSCGINSSYLSDTVMMSVVMVKLYFNGLEINTYACLDSLSSGCFMSEGLWRLIGTPGEQTRISVRTLNEEKVQSSVVVSDLSVSSLCNTVCIKLPNVFVQDILPVGPNDIVSHNILRKYSHLSHLVSEVPDFDCTVPIGLLIGVNCPKAMQPIECIPSSGDSPSAIRTPLGWCIAGPVHLTERYDVPAYVCNATSAKMVCSVKDCGPSDMLKCMYESDFTESGFPLPSHSKSTVNTFDKGMSQNDKKFIDLMTSNVARVESHYQLPLPFNDTHVSLPNNRNMALQRLHGLQRRFSSNPKYHADYVDFMNNMLLKGYAKKSSSQDHGKWYIPHHGVYHPHKPKLRVVFDCSFQCKGNSLNKSLLSGPDLTNSLIGVLLRFRQDHVAVMADIESMFYQVLVPDSYQNYLRFLWWPGGDTSLEPQDYQMTVHLFGATSSPSCANFALRKVADDFEGTFGVEVADTLRRNFYVDDMLKSVSDEPTAISQVHAVKAMCASGGFNLTKFISNSKEVIQSIPLADRSKDIQNVDLSSIDLPLERALGVNWCIENDVFGFRITLKDKPFTRRGILSTVSSIYDPLGFVAPFLLKGKKLLQSLCHSDIGWDDEVNEEARSVWERWRSQLPCLERLQVDRCYKPSTFGVVKSVSLHNFSDASCYAYGQCSYLRLVDENDQINCCLVMGKSRVTPVKPVTIPRLELVAATVSVKVNCMLMKELDYPHIDSYYWTDSNAVLGYVSNESKRYHVFVANRVQVIRENSELSSWHYVRSEQNPADDASRGLNCDEASSDHRWYKGPDFLWNSLDFLPVNCATYVVSDSDPEVRKHVVTCATVTVPDESTGVAKLFEFACSWYKLKRLISWVLICINQLKCKVTGSNIRNLSLGLTAEDLHTGELSILKYVQFRAFTEELKCLQVGNFSKPIKSSSVLCSLCPVVNHDGLICVGGRLQNSVLSAYSKHPIVLPKSSRVSRLIIESYHRISLHSGCEFVLSLVRERFWIIGARRLVKEVQRNCFVCRKLFSQPLTQQMAALPEDRVTADLPPFTHVGVDYFGPFLVKIGRSEVKRYGCLFTCLTLRAVHLEVSHSLDTDSFINCLQRFICRRGSPVLIRSDNGSNFVGAERELRDAIRGWNQNKLENFLHQKEINWKFNTPTASHMGGIWERQIRSIRKLLNVLTTEQVLSEESLPTMFCLIENVLNSRPLTPVSDDPTDLEALTPNHLLQLRTATPLPPGNFVQQDLYVRRRWRQVQFLVDLFWSRWQKEYLPLLHRRAKWNTISRNLKTNDFVLLMDNNLPRNSWVYGRIEEVFPGKDGLVRSVRVKTKNGLFVRPIHKLCLLEGDSDD